MKRLPLFWLATLTPIASASLAFVSPQQRQIRHLFLHQSTASSSSDSSLPPRKYTGPVLSDEADIVAAFGLDELGLDLVVAESTVAPGSLGLYVRLAEGVTSTTCPCMQLVCGYAREGSFDYQDVGDKTVGFAMGGLNTAVVFEKQFMTIQEALRMASCRNDASMTSYCGLSGHVVTFNDDGEVEEISVDHESDFPRFYVPVNPMETMGDNAENAASISIQNLGQFCNDLAWSFENPPANAQDYNKLSQQQNALQLVWRLEWNGESQALVPTWPVTVFADDLVFENVDLFMELGTKYGWNYWQATVDLNKL